MTSTADELGRFGDLYDGTCVTAYDLALRMLHDPERAERALETAYADVWSRLRPAGPDHPRVLIEVLVSVRQAALGLLGTGDAA